MLRISLQYLIFSFFFFELDNKAVGIVKVGQCFTIEPMICEGDWRDEIW